ncbi:hypothetical protein HaLaN_21844, partial [Haematococcus lacustris]
MSAQWSTDMATNPALAGLLMAAGLQALRVTKAFGSVVDLGSFLARASGLPPITAPVYMEVDSNTAGGTGSDSTRALRATVMYAPSCDSQLSNYRAATLNIQQSMATGQAVS